MQAKIHSTHRILGRASKQLLSNNIEVYEHTVPQMLSDRLRNGKFASPENPQTGVASEWEPIGNSMQGLFCKLTPGLYLSGREAQVVHNYAQNGGAGILQVGVFVQDGEVFEVELWARAQHRPVTVHVQLRLPGQSTPSDSLATMEVNHAHWRRYTCRLTSPGAGEASFRITIPGDSRVALDQIHLRQADQSHVSPALLDAFDKFPCPTLRFPGGCASCTYHWEHGIGPVHLRPVCDDPVFKYKIHYDFGIDEYLELCDAKQIRPFITLNTTTATPEQAAAWAAYVRNWYIQRNLAVPEAYFMFGNENHGAWELGHMTGEMYAAQLHEFSPPVRAAYPKARLIAIGNADSDGLRNEYKTPWRGVVLEQAADQFDVLGVTRYGSAIGGDQLSLQENMNRVADNVTIKQADLQEQAQAIRDSGLDRTICIAEWNYWTCANHNDHAGFYEPNDIRHCLFAAGYLNTLCRLGPMVEVANYYSLVNTMGMIHMRDDHIQYSDIVKVMNLFAPALPGDVLALDVDAPLLTEKSRTLDANFLRNGDDLYGFLINYHATESLDVELNDLGTVQETCGLTARAILEPVMEFEPAIADNVITLPPMSILRIRSHHEEG